MHPILGFIAALAGALDRVQVVEPAFMTADEQRQALVELARQRSRMEALELRVLAAADRNEVGARSGATSTASWLSHTTLVDRPDAAARVKLARALDERHRSTATGLAAGDHSEEHAAVIVRALDDLAADVSGDYTEGLLEPSVLARAEKTLVEEAGRLTPKQLRVAGRHLLEVVAPEAADVREQERLDRSDAAAFAVARFTTRALGDGTSQGWFRVPDLHVAILRSALEAISAPRKKERLEPDPVTGRAPDHATVLGQALCELLEHLPTEGYGEHGGLAATLVVTLDHAALTTGLGSAALADGTPLSAGEARRLACGAGIIPAVLGGASAVLDLGRERRLFSKAQRIALTLRDKRCRAEGCDRPPSWTEAHHLSRWSDGGTTDLGNAVLLCGHHHRLAHSAHYDHGRLPNGDVRYHRRT